jgi:hypothetical protein
MRKVGGTMEPLRGTLFAVLRRRMTSPRLPNDPGFNPRGFTEQAIRLRGPEEKWAAISRHLQGRPKQGEALLAPPGSNPC